MNNRNSLQNDIQFGIASEAVVLKRLEKHFGEVIIKSKHKFAKYDGKSETKNYEIKTRRNTMRVYPTTIISAHKIEGAVDGGVVFTFQFVDCLCYIVYNEKDFYNFKRKEITYYRDGTEPKPVTHIEIPIEQLIEIKMGCDDE